MNSMTILIDRVHLIKCRRNDRTAMTSTGRRWIRGLMLLRVLMAAVPFLDPSFSDAATMPAATADAEKICMPEGTYPMIGGGTTAFSRSKTCFSRPVSKRYSWEEKVPRAQSSATDTFSGARVARYDYHDALYQCSKRGMRLATLEELKALFAYANSTNSAGMGGGYAIVAQKGDSHYSGGLYGWGGASVYWSHTFAGKGFHKVINLSNGRVSIYDDSRVGYVSCVR
jgi:hypothetical protein